MGLDPGFCLTQVTGGANKMTTMSLWDHEGISKPQISRGNSRAECSD